MMNDEYSYVDDMMGHLVLFPISVKVWRHTCVRGRRPFGRGGYKDYWTLSIGSLDGFL